MKLSPISNPIRLLSRFAFGIIACTTAGLLTLGTAMAGNLENSKVFFDKLNAQTLDLVDQFYDANVMFQDPVHKLNGATEVKRYYEGLYKNVDAIRFEFENGSESGSNVTLPWKMHLKTPSINSGKEFTVDGVSIIHFSPEGKAIYHRDYFDMGEFVYERVPVLRSVIFYIKKKMSGSK